MTTNILTITKYAIVSIIIIWIIFTIFKHIKFNGKNYNQRLLHNNFINIHGDQLDNEAKNALYYGEQIYNPTADDHYKIASVYLLNAKQPEKAFDHFNTALEIITKGNVPVNQVPFLLNRIEDYNKYLIELDEILPIQQATHAYYEQQKHHNADINKKRWEIKIDDPEYKEKTILNKQDWQSDSQNVHDSIINHDLKYQITKVVEDNSNKGLTQTYNDAIKWIRRYYQNNVENLEKVNKVINEIDKGNYLGNIPNLTEKDVLETVWQRAHDPENENSGEIKEALAQSILDCFEKYSPVCISGRAAKIWQSLAKLDKEDQIGVLKTKQLVRNEIFEKAAKIVSDLVGENGSVSKELKEAYNNCENTEEVNNLIDTIKSKLDELKKEYENIIDKKQLNAIIEECKAVV